MEATRAVIPTVIAGTTGQLQHQNLGIVNDDDDVLFSHFNNNGDEDNNNNEFEKELDKMWKRTMKDIRNLDPNQFWKIQALPLARIKKIMKSEEFVMQELEKEKQQQQLALNANNSNNGGIQSSSGRGEVSMTEQTTRLVPMPDRTDAANDENASTNNAAMTEGGGDMNKNYCNTDTPGASNNNSSSNNNNSINAGSETTSTIRFMISSEAPVLVTKACELFIQELSTRAWKHTDRNRRRTLQRSDIHAAVGESETFDFLIDIIPRVVVTTAAVARAPQLIPPPLSTLTTTHNSVPAVTVGTTPAANDVSTHSTAMNTSLQQQQQPIDPTSIYQSQPPTTMLIPASQFMQQHNPPTALLNNPCGTLMNYSNMMTTMPMQPTAVGNGNNNSSNSTTMPCESVNNFFQHHQQQLLLVAQQQAAAAAVAAAAAATNCEPQHQIALSPEPIVSTNSFLQNQIMLFHQQQQQQHSYDSSNVCENASTEATQIGIQQQMQQPSMTTMSVVRGPDDNGVYAAQSSQPSNNIVANNNVIMTATANAAAVMKNTDNTMATDQQQEQPKPETEFFS